jgi:hypothetical protein
MNCDMYLGSQLLPDYVVMTTDTVTEIDVRLGN